MLKVHQYVDHLFCYDFFVVTDTKEKADTIVKEKEGTTTKLEYVKSHDIVDGLTLEGGGNG